MSDTAWETEDSMWPTFAKIFGAPLEKQMLSQEKSLHFNTPEQISCLQLRGAGLKGTIKLRCFEKTETSVTQKQRQTNESQNEFMRHLNETRGHDKDESMMFCKLLSLHIVWNSHDWKGNKFPSKWTRSYLHRENLCPKQAYVVSERFN